MNDAEQLADFLDDVAEDEWMGTRGPIEPEHSRLTRAAAVLRSLGPLLDATEWHPVPMDAVSCVICAARDAVLAALDGAS